MHSSRELRSSAFAIEIAGRRGRLHDLFEGFGEQDRLGVVLNRPCGAVGASALIAATIAAFYDFHRARGDDFFVYPDYYLFHVGRPLGDHARLDVWPRRKEVVVGEDPQEILEAIDDRAITRLAVPDERPGETPADAAPDERPGETPVDAAPSGPFGREALASAPFGREALASARGRIATCLAYSASGRVSEADVRIASNPIAEGYVEAILDPEARIGRLRADRDRDGGDAALEGRIAAIEERLEEVEREVRVEILRARAALVEDGAPVETYRRISLDEALRLLGSIDAIAARPTP